jgi:methylated-DNA-[protein]-cysteine S-methyltransferase
MLKKYVESYYCALGHFNIFCSEAGITSIQRTEEKYEERSHKFIGQAKIELDEYFDRKLKVFTVPLDLESGTSFQKQVWRELSKMDYGTVYSYSQLAIICGNVKKVRAIGKANGANPIPIIIPCHRIIGKGGNLVGYSGGLDMKKYLLKLEKAPIMGDLFL